MIGPLMTSCPASLTLTGGHQLSAVSHRHSWAESRELKSARGLTQLLPELLANQQQIVISLRQLELQHLQA